MKKILAMAMALLVAGQAPGLVVQPGEEITAEDGAVLQVPVEQTDVVYALLYLGSGVVPGEVWGIKDGDGIMVVRGSSPRKDSD